MNKYDAIRAINSSVVTIHGDEAFDAAGNPVSYNEADVQAYIDANAYKTQRATAYQPIGDQLDALFKASVFPAEMAAAIQAVKDKYPKEQP